MKVTIELTEPEDVKIYMQAYRMYTALGDLADYLRSQDKYTDNDVTEMRAKFNEILTDNEVSLG